ncbi:peptidoglycan-binding protein [Hazenella sp. IB182357]|uniref:Peptidoglycan-binding protein n=2 Tax=Polycladospora coralii TaxID=2771432 RepID=A0A926RU14_9BACL|nr:peptidoglycan-binding protein [Polycladospora coralii]MBS7531217.1 peptidoglycan-binding protein [Polycladospora coralii]
MFEANTEAKVREFQKTQGLKVDGIVGRMTWGKLFKAGMLIIRK